MRNVLQIGPALRLVRYNIPVMRLRHILRNTGILLSLSVAILFTGLWVRSYYIADRVAFGIDGQTRDGRPKRSMMVSRANRGRIFLVAYKIYGSMLNPAGSLNPSGLCVTHLPTIDDLDYDVAWKKLGLQFLRYRHLPALEGGGVRMPIWFRVLIFSLWPLVWLIRFCLRAKRPSNLCPICGYDLRATPDRCPECGTAAALQVAVNGQ
jgi:hypothetical protein